MSNSNLTPTVVTKEALTILHNNLVFTRNVNRQYDDSNTVGGQKNGGSVKVRLPNKYITSTGAALDVQDNAENSVTLTQTTQRHVDTNFTTSELTNDIDTFSERILQPGISVLASMFDYDMMAIAYKGVANSVGTPGTTPATTAPLLDAHKYMNYFGTPQSQRCMVMNPDANAGLVAGLQGLFNPQGKIAENYNSGVMSMNQLGYRELAMSQSTPTHTNGAFGGTVLIDGTVSTEGSTTIHVDALTAAAAELKAGDTFTVAAVYSVNPETKQSTGKLQQFTLTADATAASNEVDLIVTPAMYTSASGGLQNIDAFPQDGAAVTFVGTASTAYPQNLAFHKDFMCVGTTDLEMPDGVHFSARQVMDGVSMRLVRQYRIGNDDIPCRIDILYGGVVARGETACRVWG
jgi:hypothetical protein